MTKTQLLLFLMLLLVHNLPNSPCGLRPPSCCLSLLIVTVAVYSVAVSHVTILDIILNAGDTSLSGELFRLLLQQAIVVHFQSCRGC
jgi:hypothetical protein